MAAIDYLRTHNPPVEMVKSISDGMQISLPSQATKFLAILACSGFVHWMKQGHGEIWAHNMNGAYHEHPGMWESITAHIRGEEYALDVDNVLVWKKGPIKTKVDGAPLNSDEHVRTVFQSYCHSMKEMGDCSALNTSSGKVTYLPNEILQRLPEGTPSIEAAVKAVFKWICHIAGAWFVSDVGRLWMGHGGPFSGCSGGDRFQRSAMTSTGSRTLLDAIYSFEGPIYTYRSGARAPLTPLVEPFQITRTHRRAEYYCEECGEQQPCVKRDGSMDLCSRCAGYVNNSRRQDQCSGCDRDPSHTSQCTHWGEFFAYQGHQRLLAAP